MLQSIWSEFSTYNFVCPCWALTKQATKNLKLCKESALKELFNGDISMGELAM